MFISKLFKLLFCKQPENMIYCSSVLIKLIPITTIEMHTFISIVSFSYQMLLQC